VTNFLARTQTLANVGNVECLNCGRTLAAAFHRATDGAIRIRPRPDGTMDVEISGTSRLLCRRCGGRAFVEFDRAA
jgi:ribosomal protein L37E